MRRRARRNPIGYLPAPLVIGLGVIAGGLTFAIARVLITPAAPAVVKV